MTVSGAVEPYGTAYVEVIGRAQPDGSVQQMTMAPWGNEFDLDVYNKLVDLLQKHKGVLA